MHFFSLHASRSVELCISCYRADNLTYVPVPSDSKSLGEAGVLVRADLILQAEILYLQREVGGGGGDLLLPAAIADR